MLRSIRFSNRMIRRIITGGMFLIFFIILMSSTSEATSDTPQTGTLSPSDVSFAEASASPGGDFGGAENVHIFSGSFTYSYPIAVPPGRGGLAPKLALTYSSSGKNGWLGMGWDLTITSIERNTKFGAPNYNDNDTFIIKFNGSDNTLVEMDTVNNEFRLKNEGPFLRLVKQGDSWVVTDKKGTNYYFGTTSNSKLEDVGRIFPLTFRWCLDRTQDANGNEIFYTYYKDTNNNQIYLSQIDYDVNNHIVFEPDSGDRSDAHDMYSTFFKVRMVDRLKTVKVFHGSVSNPGNLVRRYELDYSYSNNTDRSILDSITPYGSNGTPLPPVMFDRTERPSGDALDYDWGTRPVGTSDGPFQGGYGDFNGDGLTDYAYRESGNYTFHVMKSTGNGFEDEEWGTLPVPAATGPYQGGFGDFNGDGKTDYAYRESGGYTFHVMRSTGSDFVPENWGTLPAPAATGPYECGFGDFNGDGKTDYAYRQASSQTFHVMLSTGTDFLGFLPQNWGTKPVSTSEGPYEGMYGDMNSDGMTDYVYREQGTKTFHVMLSTGSGFVDEIWGTRPVNASDGPHEGSLGDFNGDGNMEYAYREKSTQTFHVMMKSGPFPDLLNNVTTTMGATIDIDYTPSSAWQNHYLPFIMQTVTSVTTDDNMGHQATITYSYEGGKYEPVSREFRGFEKVIVTNEETGMTTETKHHQDQVYQGRVEWAETKDINDKLGTRIDNDWDSHSYGDSRAFPYIEESSITHYKDDGSTSIATITTKSEYDNYGNRTFEHKWTSDGLGRYTRTVYDNDSTNWILGRPVNIRVDETDPGPTPTGTQVLRETKMEYDPTRPWLLKYTRQVHWENSTPYEYTTEYDYDNYGNRTSIIDPLGHPTTIDYSESNGMFPNWTTNALGHTIHQVFDPAFGVVLTETDPNNQTTTYIYDEFGRVDYISYPDGAFKDFTYNIQPGSHYERVQASDSPTATVYYDNLGRKWREIVDDGNIFIWKYTLYDNAGRVWRESLPFQGPPGSSSSSPIYYTTYVYDHRGRVETQTNPDNTSKAFQYNGLTEVITDENNHHRTITKDSLGRLKQVQEPTGGITDYDYDIFDNLIYVKDPVGNETFITFDDLGRKILMNDPYMGVWEYAYDAASNLIWQKDGEGREATIAYDTLNRMDLKQYITTGKQVHYVYDEARPGYFNTGSLTTVYTTEPGINPNTIISNFDLMGRLVNETRIIDGVNYTTDRNYDLAGRLDYITYPDAALSEFDYIYNAMGYLEKVEKVEGSGRYIIAEYGDYNPLGQIGYVSHGNGSSTDYLYWPGNFRLQQLQTYDGLGGMIQDLSYTFDDVGNVEAITDATNSVNHSFVYDEVDRLTNAVATCSSDPARRYNQTYTYDLAGNMTTKTGIGGWQVLDWEKPVKHLRPTSVMYAEEVAGVGERDITYNQENKPIYINYNGQESYLYYDGAGNRIKKMSGAQTTIYVGGIYEIRNGEPIMYVYANGKQIASIKGTQKYFTHADHLGSTSVVTDDSGQMVEEIGYLPFGATLFRNASVGGQWTSVYRFTGQEYDTEYELYNYGARLYDPIMGRFISADTLVPDYTNPQSLNRYIYCYNNPLLYVDPSGHFGIGFSLGIIDFYIGTDGISGGAYGASVGYNWKTEEVTVRYGVSFGYRTSYNGFVGIDCSVSYTYNFQTGESRFDYSISVGIKYGSDDEGYIYAGASWGGRYSSKTGRSSYSSAGFGYKKGDANLYCSSNGTMTLSAGPAKISVSSDGISYSAGGFALSSGEFFSGLALAGAGYLAGSWAYEKYDGFQNAVDYCEDQGKSVEEGFKETQKGVEAWMRDVADKRLGIDGIENVHFRSGPPNYDLRIGIYPFGAATQDRSNGASCARGGSDHIQIFY